MKEKTFLLFKPSAFSSIEIYEFILKRLKDSELVVEKDYFKQLNSWQICNLWPRQCADQLLFYTWKELYGGYIKIMEVSGDEAIKKVDKIKGETRSIYAAGIIRNCIHAPSNTAEYREHIKIIYDNKSQIFPLFNELPFSCYHFLNENMSKMLARYIVGIGWYTLIHATIPYEASSNKFRFYLVEDDIHSFTDYVCFIYDNFGDFDFYKASVMATILETYGEVCLLDIDEERDAEFLIQSGKKFNMTIQCHKILKM